jgi:hypothetical protein
VGIRDRRRGRDRLRAALIMHPQADVKSVIAKCLGALWILDGLLQFQPPMFGQEFVTNVLVPNLSAQPHWMYDIVNFGIYLWNLDPALNDLGVGLLQIAIGLLLLLPLENKWFRFGAWVSIIWGVVVWFCGEGMGLLLTGVASFYTGAPGAVLLYILLAAMLLVPHMPAKRFVQIGAIIFIFGAALQLQSAFWTSDGVSGAAMAAMMEPIHALNAFPIYLAKILGSNVVVANWLLILVPLAIGVWLLWKPNRAAGIVAFVFLCFVWWIGQDFGMLSTFPTGTGTDPSTAPLLALFLLPLFVTALS